MAVTITTAARNAASNSVVDLVDAGAGAGKIVFETSGSVEVSTLVMSDPAFGNAATGVATAGSISDDTNATGGTTSQFSMQDSNSLEILTGSVTVTSGGGDIELSSVIIGAGDTVSISALTVTMPAT